MNRALTIILTALLGMGSVHAQTYSKTETITYHDNLSKWVIGQTTSVTCAAASPASDSCNGDVVSATTYDPTYALPTSQSEFGKIKQSMTYDVASTVESGQRGTLKTVADGKGSLTTLTLWKRGLPGKITYPATTDQPTAVSEQAAINDDGTIASVTDENGSKTCYGYDAMGRLASITYPSETTAGVCDTSKWATTTLSFKPGYPAALGLPAGHWRQIIQTGNGRKTILFDALWRPVVEQNLDLLNIDNTKSEVAKRYDAAGRLAFQSYPMRTVGNYTDTTLKGIRTTYDALDRPQTVVQDSELGPLTTTTAYLSNVSGPYVQVTSPRGQVTRTWHQNYDQPSNDFPVIVQNLGGQYTYITRDPFGKPTSLRRSDSNTPTGGTGINRLYTYNAYQELCRTVEPETGATLMGYDAAGNLAWSASGLPAATACDIEGDTAAILARKAARTYDARNRLKTLTFPDHRGDQVWTYTPNSLPATLTAANPNVASPTRTSYTYSRRGLLTKEVLQPLGGAAAFAASYGYDANGFMSQIGYPSALTVLLSPDALGRPTRAGTYATDVRYHPNGAIAQFTYGNGIVHTMAQNARGLPDTSTDAYGSTAFLSDGLDYDQNGNPAAITDGATGRSQRGNRTMVYDALDRLTSVTSPMFGTATYAYDALDNLTHAKVSGGSKVRDHYYCSNAQWQVAFVRTGPTCTGSTPSPAVLAIEYDVQGNVSNRDSAGFGFDFGNRLRTSPGLWYAYDGLGRRILSCTTGACSYQFYTQAGQRLYVDDKAADQPTDYIYLGNSLVAQRTLTRATGVYDTRYLHTDALGSPVLVTNEARAVVERSEYEPYGQVLNRPLRDGPGYTGHVEDKTSGMVYMQQRYYDPTIGRFLSVDPVTADANNGALFNRYMYAANNPYRFFDPDGRCTGSHIENKDGTCASTGGFTTMSSTVPTKADLNRAMHPQPQQSRSLGETVRHEADKAWDEFTDKVLPAIGPEGALGSTGVKAVGAGMLAVKLGRAGEDAVRAAYAIGGRGFFRVGWRLRISDGMTATTLSEVKNVGSLSFTSQLRDYVDFAKSTGRAFDLYVRPNTTLSGPLVDAVKAGDITLKFIP